ncbi:putative OmpA/MotB [uncultured delta proteobacterium]|uniref:Putative OmpA/MotB n=1 Tax=uncultured delta proteobacterium TaxID=34034 RepID=A0A212J7M2_9DELT|nr:putative OmpA/MotB [uncultured delta proteobacterium]
MTDLDALSPPSVEGTKAESQLPGTEPDDAGSAGHTVDATLTRDVPPPPDNEELIRLRELLFSREIALLDNIREALDSRQMTAKRVSDVLAEAIHLRSGKDPHLSMALEPVVDAIVKTSLHTRRNDFVNALFPLMGPTIRKSMSESFRSMLGSFSKSVEMAFSWKGLRWRFEAMRSGKPFSEIVMLNTLVYRVEQLFFIHSDTGLVLSHVANESVESQDADMVSAMLTAIQDFVRDCFAGGREEDLDSLQMGEFTIYIEKAPQAYLACVVRGTPPADFRSHLRATLDLMLVEYADTLESFNGDTEPFADAVRYLDSCLLSRYVDENKKLPFWAKALPVALLLACIAGGGWLYYTKERARTEQAAFTASMHTALGYLRNEPGLMLINVVEAPAAPWEILVLKDALTPSPEEVLRGNNVDPALFSVRSIPFISYDPSVVMRRVKKSIQPPDSVTMVFDEKGTLTFTGTAPMSWIVATREDARAIPGVEHVDVDGVRDPMMDRISFMIHEIETAVIEFPLGKDTPLPADMPALKKAIDTLIELENITKKMGFSATLTIYGHADTVGNDRRNYEISQARARTVAAMLYGKGSSMPVATYGMGSEYPRGGHEETAPATARGGDQANRRIELRVHFALSPSAKPEMFRR